MNFDTAELVGPWSFATALVVLAVVVVVVKAGRSFYIRWRNIEGGVQSIDRQVNHVDAGDTTTLRQMVMANHEQVALLRGDLAHIRIHAAAAAEHGAEARKVAMKAAADAAKAAERVDEAIVLITQSIAEQERKR